MGQFSAFSSQQDLQEKWVFSINKEAGGLLRPPALISSYQL